MLSNRSIKSIGISDSRLSIVPALVFIALPLLSVILLLYSAIGGFGTGASYDFLLPWIFILGLTMTAPMVLLYRRGQFWIADPLVFATLTYFVPAFVIGGLFFALGWSQPAFQTLILDPSSDLPFTVIVIGLGYVGLASGYLLPFSERIGKWIESALPKADYPTWSYYFPGVLLIGVGVSILGLAFSIGVLGYQIADTATAYDGLVQISTMYWTMASFLLWLLIFRQASPPPYVIPIIIVLIVTSLAKILVSGGRGAIIQIATVVLLAFVLSGRSFRIKEAVVSGMLLSVALIVGMIYGTTFRSIKGTERTVGPDQYIESVVDTFKELERRDLSESFTFGFTNLVERVDILSTVAVVVSNHEHLKPFEEQYGINDNIWTDLTTFFVPRVFWPDKPTASDARRYSDLYFNYAESSYSITPMGDLIRNYGLLGVFLGMFAFGIVIRIIYSALIDRENFVIWKVTLFFMLISTISYEAFYGTMFPTMVKIGFLTVTGLIFVTFVAGKLSVTSSRKKTPI